LKLIKIRHTIGFNNKGNTIETNYLIVGNEGNAIETNYLIVRNEGNTIETNYLIVGNEGNTIETNYLIVRNEGTGNTIETNYLIVALYCVPGHGVLVVFEVQSEVCVLSFALPIRHHLTTRLFSNQIKFQLYIFLRQILTEIA
jgi:hypothetical protein